MKKPANLVYGSDEIPPHSVTVISAIQHVGVVAIFMVYPLIIAREAGAPAEVVTNILRMCMLALAVAVALQALPRGPVGSRFLAPSIFTGVYLAPSLIAAKIGGLPLVWGMTVIAGLVEIGLSRVWGRLRTFIPPETAGLVVLLIGVIIGLAAFRVMVGENTGGSIPGKDALVAAVSIGVMIGLNIWNKGRLRLFCILIGMLVGYLSSGFTGHITAAQITGLLALPVFALPSVAHISYAFDLSMLIPFAVSGLAAAMSTTAVITTYQRLNDADWVRPEMKSISGGIFGDGIAATVAGLLGTYGLVVSTANVGLVAATGVASRRIAYVVAALLALGAFQPTMVGILTIMPPPVMAAALLFTAVFIMIGGVQIIVSRVLDPRRTLVIGMGMMAFFAESVFPNAFKNVPHWVEPFVGTPLVLATIVALGLNLIFRLGIRRTVEMTIEPRSADLQEVVNFIERAAGGWGARRDVINRVEFAAQQSVEAVVEYTEAKGPIRLSASYDEFDIDVKLAYEGIPLVIPRRPPSEEELLESAEGPRLLAGFLVGRQADRVSVQSEGGRTVLDLHFRH
jgi:NCS2 family nucleobase:cation symporter-2